MWIRTAMQEMNVDEIPAREILDPGEGKSWRERDLTDF
jgi:hypothetical protein